MSKELPPIHAMPPIHSWTPGEAPAVVASRAHFDFEALLEFTRLTKEEQDRVVAAAERLGYGPHGQLLFRLSVMEQSSGVSLHGLNVGGHAHWTVGPSEGFLLEPLDCVDLRIVS